MSGHAAGRGDQLVAAGHRGRRFGEARGIDDGAAARRGAQRRTISMVGSRLTAMKAASGFREARRRFQAGMPASSSRFGLTA
jgi:hypothetical protein